MVPFHHSRYQKKRDLSLNRGRCLYQKGPQAGLANWINTRRAGGIDTPGRPLSAGSISQRDLALGFLHQSTVVLMPLWPKNS